MNKSFFTLFLSLLLSHLALAGEAETNAAYPRGDAYFLVGNLEKESSYSEFGKMSSIARWLAQQGFRPILNPYATITDLREAVQNERAALIIWSSHGSANGVIKDARQNEVPVDIFAHRVGPRLSRVVISACHGECIVKRYQFSQGTRQTYWTGTTNTTDLFDYLIGDRFNSDLFNAMANNPRSVALPGGALPGQPHKQSTSMCLAFYAP